MRYAVLVVCQSRNRSVEIMSKNRQRHLYALFIIAVSTGAIIGSLLMPYLDQLHIIFTSIAVLCVAIALCPAYDEVYND